ncbi:MAG: tRNA (N6-isopentenyl adenosine(37)-C2)-methylthiotransferase MiaB [Bryobacterales bacterium]|nr:tRNA (N6-isopentenyl adenosine(37)-C2)-methylthiotransferase MiaB [Bryobacterales bacterium]
MKTFYLETFGCQMNVHDSEKVVGTLLARGYRQVDSPEQADLILYNTCSIREKAEQKVYSRLQQFRREAGSGKVFGVLGCVAQQEGERIFERAPHVALVCGSASYRRLPELLDRIESGDRRVTGLELETEETFETPLTRRDNPYRAYITIIEGCDKHCTFCVVPFTRGPERSRPSESILREARELAAAGYTEIQLLGQNVSSYRDPSPAGWDFATLLEEVAKIPGLRRVRFTTSHPRDFDRRIVRSIEENPVLANHVHLPVQSGSNRVLERMRRQYTREEYLEKIGWMKSARRPIALSTDIIVGFPGETEEDFEQTLSLLDQVGYDAVFSFKYSARPNTAALALDGHLSEEEKGRRLAILQEKQRAIQLRRNSEWIGRRVEVLVESFNPGTGQWVGRTSENRVVNFTSPLGPAGSLAGRYVQVCVTRAGPNSLAGEQAA